MKTPTSDPIPFTTTPGMMFAMILDLLAFAGLQNEDLIAAYEAHPNQTPAFLSELAV